MSTIQIGVDLAKSVFEVAVSGEPGVVQSRHRLTRTAFPRFLAGHPPAEVLLEACGSAHHWGREAQRLGHRVRLLHPADVARYRDGNKTDRADAKALLEAARNQGLTPVPVKSVEQQAIVALHRVRAGYLRTRTARINALRGHLRELGYAIPIGARRVTVDARTARIAMRFERRRDQRGRVLQVVDTGGLAATPGSAALQGSHRDGHVGEGIPGDAKWRLQGQRLHFDPHRQAPAHR